MVSRLSGEVRYLCETCEGVHRTANQAADCHFARVAEVVTDDRFWQRYYNGYVSQDAFHRSLVEAGREYAEARRAAYEKDGGRGWEHADCDHAYGICSQGEW